MSSQRRTLAGRNGPVGSSDYIEADQKAALRVEAAGEQDLRFTAISARDFKQVSVLLNPYQQRMLMELLQRELA